MSHPKRWFRAGVVSVAVLALSAQATLAMNITGELSCSSIKRVYIFSRATIDITHSWQGGSRNWTHYVPTTVINNTNKASTPWAVFWNVTKESAGAYCSSPQV